MRVRRVAGILFVVAVFAFLGVYVYRNVGDLRAQEWTIRPGVMVLSLLLHILGLLWGVGAWRMLLEVMGQAVPYRQLARIAFLSGLGRYIPGKVWQFVGAAQLGRASGLAAGTIVTALAAHTIFFLIGATVVSVYFVPRALGVSDAGQTALRWLTPLLLLLVHPAVIRSALHLLKRVTRRELGEWTGGWGSGLGLVVLSVTGWLITGIAFYLFILSFTPLPVETLPTVIGINAASFIAGTLLSPAPAGLGTKEWALTWLLAGYVTGPMAAVLAIASRLWTVAAEVFPALALLPGSSTASPGEVPSVGK